MKFNDANGNGLLDPGEAGVGGITIQLFSGSDAEGSPLATAVSDGSGNFSFTNLTAGTYSVAEVLPSGYRQTTPSVLGRGFVVVSIAPGQNVQDVLFGNQLIPAFGAISGMKFNDLNGNGVLDPGEPGLAGVTIEVFGIHRRRRATRLRRRPPTPRGISRSRISRREATRFPKSFRTATSRPFPRRRGQ